ncbi:MAG: hypothetical protein KUF74_18370 [Candidatus Thiodiazotropha sp. (ex Ctena orbiculata)]|nr:hypothetical protein [Candidatus Thiodiazotropha taylori]
MQTIRSNLTRMKSLAEKKLPDEQDIFGYPGISKELIISFIDESYELSYTLNDLEPKFEITVLKRKIGLLIEECKNFLNEGVSSWSKQKKFDKFVSNLTKIREDIRLTYLAVVDKALRTESATAKIIEDYDHLSESYKQYEEEFELISEKHESVTEAYQAAQNATETLSEYLEKAKGLSESISSLQTESESSFDLSTKFESEIREKREFIVELSGKLSGLEKKARTMLTKAETHRKEFDQLKQILQEQAELNEKQQKEIQDTLDNANRMGMAGSFKSRKDELDKPIKIWGGVFVAAVSLIFAVAWYFVAPYLSTTEEMEYVDLFVKIALVSPFVWLAWMSVKQYGYLSRIREDYAYKYASAMAFEGYKKHAIEIDPELLKKLLNVSVDNLSQNPIRLFNTKDNHASPVNEILRETISGFKREKKEKTQAESGGADNK